VKIPVHTWYCLTIAHRDGLVPRQHANWDLQAAVGRAGRAAEVMNDHNAERDPSPLVLGAHHYATGPRAFLHPKRVTHSPVDGPYGGDRSPSMVPLDLTGTTTWG
jgi:hypothetical protein